MIKSMTAYSRASASTPFGRFVVEIHSVNRKMLDMSLYLPKDLLRFDVEMRKWLSQSLERGQVTLRLNVQSEGMTGKLLSNYSTQLKGLKDGWEKLARELGYDPSKTIDLSFLVTQLQTLPASETKEEEEGIKKALKEVVEKALQDLMQMKETEGNTLVQDIQKRLKIIEENLVVIESNKEEPLVRYRKKLIERLKDVGHLHGEAEERIAREVALLAEKMDITEELVRLKAHIEQFRKTLSSHEKAVGRTLDFLTQEMHREINTLGSKSTDSDISLNVVRIKSELDKIREQVQNIE
jgi:uncharacterized protein (TIGR00255 family)